ncbi:carbohydrate sulfotransferase 15 [Biomphalaria glabrata]|nr:carbohydrate sulfotransferase 15 [Biomphalaria glabrata]
MRLGIRRFRIYKKIAVTIFMLSISWYIVLHILDIQSPLSKTTKIRILRQSLLFGKDENFRFSRDDLNLNFKSSSTTRIENMTYDNVNDFPCTQTNDAILKLGDNDTDDIMCSSRPKYIETYLNPCFRESYSSRNKGLVFKCLPYFHILGFDKCGTTDFHNRLTQHPQIIHNSGPMGKDIYYWSWSRYGLHPSNTSVKTQLWQYKNMFHVMSVQITTMLSQSKIQLITGDATPVDVWDFRGWPEDPQNKGLQEPRFLTPHAMRHIYKNPKFFILVRNPVDRLYSDYTSRGFGFTPEKLAVDVPIAVSLITECLRTHSILHCFFSDELYQKLPVRLHVSCYSVFLREWFSVFNRKHFFIFRTEDYHSNTKEFLRQAFDFLNVDPLKDSELEAIAEESTKQKTKNNSSVGLMFSETRSILEEFFASFNQDLATLLGSTKFLWRD